MSTQLEKPAQTAPLRMTPQWVATHKMFGEPKYRDALNRAAALTKNPVVLPDDAIKAVCAAVLVNPGLASAHPMSLLYGALMSIRTGLPIGAPLDLAYLVPRANKALDADWAYFSPSYMGRMTIAYRDPKVCLISGDSVRKNDTYIVTRGPRGDVQHVYGAPERGDLVGCYAYAWLQGAPFPLVQDLTTEELQKRIKMSKGRTYRDGTPNQDHPWNKWPDAMATARAVHKISKFLPRTPELGFCILADRHFEDPDSDRDMVRDLEQETGVEILPPTTSVDTAVPERMAERAESVQQTFDEASAAPVEYDPDGNELHIGIAGGQALTRAAARVLPPESLDQWVDDVLARRGVASLQFLAPSERDLELEALRGATH